MFFVLFCSTSKMFISTDVIKSLEATVTVWKIGNSELKLGFGERIYNTDSKPQNTKNKIFMKKKNYFGEKGSSHDFFLYFL